MRGSQHRHLVRSIEICVIAQCTGDQLESPPLGLRLQILVQSQVESPDACFLIITQGYALASCFEPLLL